METFSKTISLSETFSTLTETRIPSPSASSCVSTRQSALLCTITSRPSSLRTSCRRSDSGAESACFAGDGETISAPATRTSETGTQQSGSPNAPAQSVPFFSAKCILQNSNFIFALCSVSISLLCQNAAQFVVQAKQRPSVVRITEEPVKAALFEKGKDERPPLFPFDGG